jgi:hypothetical protein
MADIGRDATTTVQKLEGFQIGLNGNGPCFMALAVRLLYRIGASHGRLRGTTRPDHVRVFRGLLCVLWMDQGTHEPRRFTTP